MSNNTPKEPSVYRKMMDFTMGWGRYNKKQRAKYPDFYDYIEASNTCGIQIEVPQYLLVEVTCAKVGRFTAMRNSPHFNGDERHGHCDVGGGYKVAWSVSGIRRHPSKFPAQIPRDAKAAVAKVLGVSPDILLEAYWIDDDGKRVLLVVAREAGA
jgi:hypothetical protein